MTECMHMGQMGARLVKDVVFDHYVKTRALFIITGQLSCLWGFWGHYSINQSLISCDYVM